MSQVLERPIESALLERGSKSAISFPLGIPGFDGVTAWELVRHEEAEPFLWLRAATGTPLALLVIAPQHVLERYAPEISRAALVRLDVEADLEPIITLLVVHLDGAQASVNLRAPILINARSMRGEQVIIEQGEWPIRFPIG